jgi:hypothetical protein
MTFQRHEQPASAAEMQGPPNHGHPCLRHTLVGGPPVLARAAAVG